MRNKASQLYERSVRDCILEQVKGGGVTARDFAERCGFKLTHNLRKRLHALVDEGVLQSVISYTDGNRMAEFYIRPIPVGEQVQHALPLEGVYEKQ